MKQPKKRFDITTLVWRELSKHNRAALDVLHYAIRTKTNFVGKLNKKESHHVAAKFHHLGVVCWERPLDGGMIERWIEKHDSRICESVIFEGV